MKQRAAAVFISDLHLCPEQPATTQAFLDFLQSAVAGQTERLFILGDLYEYWPGDDDLDDVFNRQIIHALRQLSESGMGLFFMAGNRDLLIGPAWAAATGAMLLPDPYRLLINGQSVLLSHGDALCTDDHDYQAFRSMVRAPAWQAAFLARPLAERHAIVAQMRMQSEAAKGNKQVEIMDVNPFAVAALLRSTGEYCLIHGHTHRPRHHSFKLDGADRERWVLPDWHIDADTGIRRGGGLAWNDQGLSVISV